MIEDSVKRRKIISNIHDANHLGIHRTNDIVSKKYYWPCLYKDVAAYVSSQLNYTHMHNIRNPLLRLEHVINVSVVTKS